MINQMELDFGLTVVMGVFILIFLMVLMLYFYLKVLVIYLIIPMYFFSVVIGVMSIRVGDIPFSPYFQGFFLIFQTVLFLLSILEIRKY